MYDAEREVEDIHPQKAYHIQYYEKREREWGTWRKREREWGRENKRDSEAN